MLMEMLGVDILVSNCMGDVTERGLVRVWRKFFRVKVRLFCLWFEGCFGFGMVFRVLFFAVFAWCSMLLCVAFNVGMRGVWDVVVWVCGC